MLIWLNGAFGVGKTQTAFELARRLENAHVADPELLGFALQATLPSGASADFQDLPQWRSGVVETLRQADAVAVGPVVVPMTLVRHDYFDQVVGGLRSSGVDLRHYALTARPETLLDRLRTRVAFPAGLRRETWAVQQIDRCVGALDSATFATHVRTDGVSLDEVVEQVAADAGLVLTRPRLGPGHARLRRLRVGLTHVR